jgi:hypothetical protein
MEEKNIFKIIARQNEVRAIINSLNHDLEIINRQENAMKQELGKAGIMIGREAVEYNDLLNNETDYTLQEERKKKMIFYFHEPHRKS